MNLQGRTHQRIAWGIFFFCVLLSIGSVVFSIAIENAGLDSDRTYRFDSIVAVVFSFLGAIVASKRPENRMGWLMSAIGLSGGLGAFLPEYAHYGVMVSDLPATDFAVWVGNWVWLGCFMTVPTLMLLWYPTGRVPSRGWRWVERMTIAGLAGLVTTLALIPSGGGDNEFGANPYGIDALEQPLTILGIVSGVLLGASAIASVYSLFWRRKRATAEERQQLRWFAFGAALMPVFFMGPEPFVDSSEWFFDPTVVAFLVPPITMGIAIVRYRLYDIGTVVNRTLVYGLVTALIVAFYLGFVFGLQLLFDSFTNDSQLAVAASTLAAAALVRPLRTRVQTFIDRRFYRRKYDSKQTLERLARRLRDEVDLSVVGGDVVGVVRETVQPAHVTLWLKEPEATR